MTKFDALKNTNKIINERIETLKSDFTEPSNVSIFNSDLLHEVLYEGYNNETSYTICKILKGAKTERLIEKEFKRIICLSGRIKIYIPTFNEETVMSSQNGLLIPPNTEYCVEVLEDCEVMGVYKPRKEKFDPKIINKTIYTKENKDE